MPFFDHYPYTNLHNVNLDWVLQAVKSWGAMVEQNNQNFIDLNAANEAFKEYVTGYITNLDVQEEINNKLDQMLASGALTQYFAPYIQTDVSDWLENNLTPTSPPVDASLTIAGAAADAKATGDAIRNGSVQEVNPSTLATWEQGAISNTGTNQNDGVLTRIRSDYVCIPVDFTIKRKPGYTFSVYTYDLTGALLQWTSSWQTEYNVINRGDRLYRLSVNSSSGSGQVLVENVDNYLEITIKLTPSTVKASFNTLNQDINTYILNKINKGCTISNIEGDAWENGTISTNGGNTDNGRSTRIRTVGYLSIPYDFIISAVDGYVFSIYTYDRTTKALVGRTLDWQRGSLKCENAKDRLYRITAANTNLSVDINISEGDSAVTIAELLFDVESQQYENKRTSDYINGINFSTGLRQQKILPNLKVVYHRGVSSNAPEETLPAFKLAVERGYKYVEVDIEFTSDNVAVLLHDSEINRTARNPDGTQISGTIRVSDITYQQLLQYDFGIWKGSQFAGTKIMRLDDFMVFCKTFGLHPYLEIKLDDTIEHIENILNCVYDAGMRYNTTFTSYYYNSLSKVKDHWPEAELGLNGNVSDMLLLKTDVNKVISFSRLNESSSKLEQLKANFIPVAYWTVNTTQELLSLPVDAYDTILTDGLDMNAIKDALATRFQ